MPIVIKCLFCKLYLMFWRFKSIFRWRKTALVMNQVCWRLFLWNYDLIFAPVSPSLRFRKLWKSWYAFLNLKRFPKMKYSSLSDDKVLVSSTANFFLVRHKNKWRLLVTLSSVIWCIDLTLKMQVLFIKVHIFWEGHKILRNLSLTFVCMYCRQK